MSQLSPELSYKNHTSIVYRTNAIRVSHISPHINTYIYSIYIYSWPSSGHPLEAAFARRIIHLLHLQQHLANGWPRCCLNIMAYHDISWLIGNRLKPKTHRRHTLWLSIREMCQHVPAKNLRQTSSRFIRLFGDQKKLLWAHKKPDNSDTFVHTLDTQAPSPRLMLQSIGYNHFDSRLHALWQCWRQLLHKQHVENLLQVALSCAESISSAMPSLNCPGQKRQPIP